MDSIQLAYDVSQGGSCGHSIVASELVKYWAFFVVQQLSFY
jgi:hypothetical protein